jgi:predicted TIM-barrel fold metal-dependent hydrolase
MIIDIHTHCFPDSIAPMAISSLAKKADCLIPHTDGTVAGLKRSMIFTGVDVSVIQNIATKPSQVVSINRWAAQQQGKQIISFGTIHPQFTDYKEEIKWLKANNFKGIKLHPDYQDFFVDDKNIFPIYEAILNEGLIILFHAGMDIGIPEPVHCTPQRLRKVLDILSGGKIVAAHLGGFRAWNDVLKYLVGSDIYFDTSFTFDELGCDKMSSIITAHGTKKILFGTDSPWSDQKQDLEKINKLTIPGKDKELILGLNSKLLLNI